MARALAELQAFAEQAVASALDGSVVGEAIADVSERSGVRLPVLGSVRKSAVAFIDMPEMYFQIRWPDGGEQTCYSPSLVVHDHLVAGTTYELDDFVSRCRVALAEADRRVREKFGFGCTRSMAQLAEIEKAATSHEGGDVVVLSTTGSLPD